MEYPKEKTRTSTCMGPEMPDKKKLLSRSPEVRSGLFLRLTPEQSAQWDKVLQAGVRAQQLVSGAVAVGGTAAALYAAHRLSLDTDHLLSELETNFDRVLETLHSSPGWKTVRVQPPVLILGSLDDVPVGYRQARRKETIEIATLDTPHGPLTVPTVGELLGMKAYLAYSRHATRDYLDFAALTTCMKEEEVLQSLLKLDDQYGHLQVASVRLEVAKTLAKPEPFDLRATDLATYKALAYPWQDWNHVQQICRDVGLALAERIVETP